MDQGANRQHLSTTTTTRTTMNGTVRRLAKGGWIADITIDGRRHQLKAPTKAAALARLRDARQEPAEGHRRSAKGFPLAKARALSLAVRWAGKASERSMGIYSKTVVQFFGPDFPLEGIGAPEVERLRQHLLSQGKRPATVNHHVSAIRSFQSDALLHGHISEAPRLPSQLRCNNTRDRIFSPQEAAAVGEALHRLEHHEAADLLVFLIETGARCSEVFRLVSDACDIKAGRVSFRQTKNGKSRTIPLTARARAAAAGYVSEAKGIPVWSLCYDQLRRQFEKARDLVGLADSGLTLHSARHTCCSRLAQKGVSLPQIMRWSGHTSLASVQRYMHVDLAALSGALAALESMQ